MAKDKQDIRTSRAPHYIGWRGELLAQLALSRISDLTVYPQPKRGKYDFLVMTHTGRSVLIEVKAFSSIRDRMRDLESMEDLHWRIPTKLIQDAHESHSPIVLFLFDADTGHGRYLRLDTEPVTKPRSNLQTVHLPLSNRISEQELINLFEELDNYGKKEPTTEPSTRCR